MKIFLSYASEQIEIARSIDLALKAEGHSTFFDRASLPAGEAYNRRIRDAVEDCDLFLFLLSPEAVGSGRYPITEMEFAQSKWPSPARRLLPVMVAPTEMNAIPPYLKAVGILRPTGDIAATVAAEVARLGKPLWRQSLRQARTLVLLVVLAVTAGGIWLIRQKAQELQANEEIQRLIGPAKLQLQTRNYGGAWDLSTRAASLRPADAEVVRTREQIAMEWLRNIRVEEGTETFADIVNKVSPVLLQCATSADPQRAADCLSHLGLADFLRSREGTGGLDPAQYYRRAIAADPKNVYGHTLWAFQLAVERGSIDDIRAHFSQALASGRDHEFVRHYQFAALLYSRDVHLEDEAIRVANEIRRSNERMPPGERDHPDNWRLWNVYYDRLIAGNARAEFISALSAADHLATLRWLFPEDSLPQDKRNPFLFMRAMFEEAAGNRNEALQAYKAVKDTLARYGASGGRLYDGATESIKRLSRR